MAFFGVYTAAQAVSATDAADTIKYFGGSAISTAATVIAGSGNDIIWLGAQGFTAAYTGTLAATPTGTGGVLSASLIGQDITYSTSTTLVGTGAATGVSLTGVITSQMGASQIRFAGLYGNAGNDSIYLAPVFTAGATAAAGLTNLQNSTIGGGAGDDVIGTIAYVNDTANTSTATTALSFDEAFIEGGGGNDSITLVGNSSLFTASTIQGGQGADLIRVDDELGGFTASSLLALGGGNDTFSGKMSAFNSATIAGGGGNDSITLSATMAHATLIATDTFNTVSDFDGADLVSAIFTGDAGVGSASGVTIQAGGGNDTIHIGVTAGIAQANVYQLNAGDDLLSSVLVSSTTIQGGAGNDTIQGMSSIVTSYVQLGGGDDVFTFAGSGSAMATGLSATTLFGGAGADLFTGTSVANSRMTMGAQWGYASAGDSLVSAFDTVNFSNTGGTYLFRWTPGNASTTSFNSSTFTATNGSVNFTGTFGSNITARAEALSEAGFSEGSTFALNDGNNNAFLFISGGNSSVTTDDLLVKVGTAGVASGGSITVSAQVGITFVAGIN